MPDGNGWNEWSRYVLKELERLNHCYESIIKELVIIKSEISALKVKAGVWGLLGGCIPVTITMVVYFFARRH